MGINCCKTQYRFPKITQTSCNVCETNDKEEDNFEQTTEIPVYKIRKFWTHQGLKKGKTGLMVWANKLAMESDQSGFCSVPPCSSKSKFENQEAPSQAELLTLKETKEENKENIKQSGTIASAKPLKRNPSVQLKVDPQYFRCENTGKLEDRYQILSLIGKGAYGEVKKIRDTVTNEIRALKIMLKSTCQMTKNFSDEIRILQKLVFIFVDNSRIILML